MFGNPPETVARKFKPDWMKSSAPLKSAANA
jgi:hypothetical protein